ncbi:MAG: aspartate-semialdehyde dehydrogenase [Anaerolineae bacterium]
MARIKCGVLGATGAVGQRFIQLLANHPWFEVTVVAASDNSVGKTYAQAARWHVSADMPEAVRDLLVVPTEPGMECDVVFSALPGDMAGPVEIAFADAGYVVSTNASAHRMAPDVPLLIPEVNAEHLDLIPVQRKKRGWDRGFIVANPNCSTIHLTLALKPLHERFGLSKLIVSTMQAVSGAGYPGVPSLDIIDNVIPFIGGEEPKMETEPLKLLGAYADGAVTPADIRISAHCNRVAVRDGHTETVSVELRNKASLEEFVAAFAQFRAEPQKLNLPSAPAQPIIVRSEANRPQPMLDRDVQAGMASVVGRVRPDPVLDYKFVVLGHNTIRGAAGGAILNAELLVAKGYLTLESTLYRQSTRAAVRLPRPIVERILIHARQGAPHEVGGVLATSAKGSGPMQLFVARNSAAQPAEAYHMATDDQQRILAEIDDQGLDIFAVYHTHPNAPAYPVAAEMPGAYYTNAYYILVSLADADRPALRAYKIDQVQGAVVEYPVEVD